MLFRVWIAAVMLSWASLPGTVVFAQNFGDAANEPAPELGAQVQALQKQIMKDQAIKRAIKTDLTLKALYTQILNQLKHVSWSFEVRDANYVHDFVIRAPYPRRPTEIAIRKAQEYLRMIHAPAGTERKFKLIAKDPGLEERLKNEQYQLVQKIIKDSYATYQEMHERLVQDINAPFPELGPVLQHLEHHIKSDVKIDEMCKTSTALYEFRDIALEYLDQVIRPVQGAAYPYMNSIEAIQRAMEFLDVYQRGFDPTRSPKLYHSGRYEYYGHFLKGTAPDHIIMPTLASLGSTDILKTRGVPIGFIGVNTNIEWVDGFYQTPYEFWVHDINHTRRMFQFFMEKAKELGMTIPEFAKFSDEFVKKQLMPMISIKQADDKNVKNMKRLLKMLMFEILHEDALAATAEVVKNGVLRPPMLITPFETIEGMTVKYVMEPGATTLAYVYRKLAHDFYDMPGARVENIVHPAFRTRENIVIVAARLLESLGLVADRTTLEYYVSTDQGLPNDFKQTVIRYLREHPGEAHELDEVLKSDGRDLYEQIAAKFQNYWQSNSGYAERWKTAQVAFVDGRGINDGRFVTTESQLRAYFKDRDVPVEKQAYFKLMPNPKTGEIQLYQDIQHLDFELLAPNLQYEVVMGSKVAANLVEAIAENKLEFHTVDEGIAWLKDVCRKQNHAWLRRNAHWAHEYPEYNREWDDLAAGKQQNGVALVKLSLEVIGRNNPNLIDRTQRALLFEAIKRVEVEISKLRKVEVRVAVSGNKLHYNWQQKSGYKERWKPIVAKLDDGTPVTDEKTLRIYFDERKIPKKFHGFFAFRVTDTPGELLPIEDIWSLDFDYLAPNHQKEVLDAAENAVKIVDRIWTNRLQFKDIESASRWIRGAAQAVHQGVLDRNTNGARDNPLYNVRWSQLPPINQGHDLDQVKIAFETRFRLNPDGMSEQQKNLVLDAIAAVEKSIGRNPCEPIWKDQQQK